MKYRCAGEVGALGGASINAAFGGENRTTGLRPRKTGQPRFTPRNASCVPFRGRGPRSGEGVDGGKNDYDILILCLIALKGKRLTTFCASLALLPPLLSLTHWSFRSLMLLYKSSSHSAKCVRCASLRSGGRRLAVRIMMECYFCALPRTPFCHYVAFPLKGKRENRWHWILCHI